MKLQKIAFALKNLTTILLPEWFRMLSTHHLAPCMMPRDVPTCWNSTYDMLEFAIQYCVAIDAMTAVCDFNLRKYKLICLEWDTAMELQDILKVGSLSLLFLLVHITLSRSSKMQHCFFLVIPLTWPLSFRPWNSLTRSLQCCPNHHLTTPLQSALPLLSVKASLISTTIKQGSQKFIALQWVRSLLILSMLNILSL